MRSLVKRLAHSLGIGMLKADRLRQLELVDSDSDELWDLIAFSAGLSGECKAQLHQDLFVLLETRFRKGGFFVEFGATNGVDLSNTWVLERHFGWEGILAEPATVWHDALRANRRAAIETDCVWRQTGETLEFNMPHVSAASTIHRFSDRDGHAELRQNGTLYDVRTVSLLDLLRRHGAPSRIDYLSIDTEGSEFDILSSFDFDEYDISIITCEHNYTADRLKIFDLLTSKGYQRKFAGLSRFDDWYVRAGSAPA